MKRVIAVFGTGRSGTSLAMQVLAAAGVSVSSDTVPSSKNNLRGGFEDQQLFTLQQQFIKEQFSASGLRPDNWQGTEAYATLKDKILRIVEARVCGDDGTSAWAVKLPQMSLLLPLWLEVFNELGVDYHLIFCVRSIEATLRSFLLAYDHQTFQSAQRVFLLRNYYAARDLRSRGFLLGYEAWGKDAARTRRELLDYCSLPVSSGEPPEDTEYQAELNRGNADTSPPGEPLTIVRELSEAIGGLTCDQRHLDVEGLRPVLREIGSDLARPQSSILTALANQSPQSESETEAFWEAECRRRGNEVGRLHFRRTAEMMAHDADRERLEHDLMSSKQTVAQKRKEVNSKQQTIKQKNEEIRTIKKRRRENTPRNRLAFNIGLAVLDAYKKPFSQGLRLPVRLFSLRRETLERRKQNTQGKPESGK